MANTSKIDRYGKVFVRGESASGNTADYQILKDAKFSNLQLAVISQNGDHENFCGKMYSVGVLGHRLDIPVPLGATEFIDEALFDQAFQLQIDTLVEFGLIDKNNAEKYSSVCKRLRATSLHMWAVFFAAGKNATDLTLLNSFFAFSVVDDMMEAMADGSESEQQSETLSPSKEESKRIPYKYISQLVYNISKLFKCDSVISHDNVFAEFEKLSKNGSKHERVLLRNCAVVYRDAVDAGRRNKCSPNSLLWEIADFFQFGAVEYSSEWKVDIMGNDNAKAELMIPAMTQLRNYTIGVNWTLETLLLHNGIQLDDDLRQCGLFKMIEGLLSIYIRKLNDVYSFEKEMRSDGHEWRSNEACMLHKTRGFSVEQALGKLVEQANKVLKQIQVMCDMLLDTWIEEKHKQAEQFVGEVNRMIVRAIQAHAFIQRYHKNLVMDCYIDSY